MPAPLEQLARASAPAPLTDAVRLSGFLDLVPDPRGCRGRRYPLSALVTAAAASVLAGARSLAAITEWISDAPAWACRVLGFPVDPLTGSVRVPHPHTLRRLLVQLDGDALDRAIGSFLTARATPAGPGLRAIAVDGKALHGSRTATTSYVTLLAAMDHTGHVLAQRQVADKSNEIPAFAPLLDTIDLADTVITADALHTQHPTAPISGHEAPTTSRRSRPTTPACSTAFAGCPGRTSPWTTTSAPAPTTATRSAG
ncbi:ISAs1 family transposase [Streptomyces lavendulae]|uniref:ISAs1 family transposase n=1 Tax=Streptomyces lavendulae TaxID=1914 RepID=UPI0024A38C9A|nr:ISAs1 family transposase [Streptomyces lavendulae]GLW03951.1 hypothetical protein Slala05_75810 [Streptomyces lavendulae subsp. lavendulae]